MSLASFSSFICENNVCIRVDWICRRLFIVEATGTGNRYRVLEKRHGEKISRGQLRNTTGTFDYQILIPYPKNISRCLETRLKMLTARIKPSLDLFVGLRDALCILKTLAILNHPCFGLMRLLARTDWMNHPCFCMLYYYLVDVFLF